MKVDKKALVTNFIIFVVSCVLTLVIIFVSLGIKVPMVETGIIFLVLMSPVFFYYVYSNVKTSRKVNKLIEEELNRRVNY